MLRPTTYTSTLQVILRLFVILRCSEVLGSSSDSSQRIVQHNGRAFSRRSATQECRSLADLFAGINMQDKPIIPVSKIQDPGLEICNVTTNGASCCTRSMEEKLNQLAVVDTQDVVANSSSELQSSLASDAKLYRDHFSELLSSSENNTRNMLTSIFKIPTESANSAVEKLFSDLAAYVRLEDQHQINVRQGVNQFLDAIFPWVFTHTIDDARVVSEMTDEYRQCLSVNRKDLTPAPYGDGARRLVQDMGKSLEVARSLHDAFDLAAEAMNITNQLGYEDYCSEALTRLLYCSQCEGHGTVRPCKNFCQNVLRGCMTHVTEVNIYWNLFVLAIEKLIGSLHNAYDFQDILNSFHSKVSDSIFHYLDNAHNYHLQVITKCGYPIAGVTTEPATPGVAVSEGGEVTETTTERSSRRLLEEFPTKIHRKFSFNVIVRNIGSSRNFFGKLPDSICNSDRFSTPNNSVCWNGTSVNKYLKLVPGLSLTTQVAENPELQVPEELVPAVVSLINKLNQMTKALHNRVMPRLPNIQSDGSDETSENSGFDPYNDFQSGSGGWYPGFTDDDDFGSVSGSGTIEPSENPEHGGVGDSDEETDTVTDFDFDRTSMPSTAHPSPYRTSTHISSSSIRAAQPTTSMSASTTTARTTKAADRPIDKTGGGSPTSPGVVLPLLAVVIQRIYFRHA